MNATPRAKIEAVPSPHAAGRTARTAALPTILWIVYVGAVFIRPHEYVQAVLDAPLPPVLLALTVLATLAMRTRTVKAPQDRLMPILALLAAWSVAVNGWRGGAVIVFNDFVPLLLFYYTTSMVLDTPARFRIAFVAIAAACTVIALHGIEQAVEGVGWTGVEPIQDGRIRYLGFLNDPNDLSMAFLMALPMCAHFLAASERIATRAVAFAAMAVLLVGIYLTNSRGAMLTLMVMAAIVVVRRFGLLRSTVLLPIALPVLVLLAPSRIDDISADEDSAAGRIEAWYEGLQMLKSHPLFGVGKGQFIDHHRLTAHNSFVLAFAELGLVGYFVWLSILILSVVMIVRIVATAKSGTVAPDGRHAKLATVLGYSMIAYVGSALFLSRSYVLLYFLLVGLIVALYRCTRADSPEAMPEVDFRSRARMLLLSMLGSVAATVVLVRVLLPLI